MTLEDILSFLHDVEMFGNLNDSELSEIVSIMDVQSFRANQRIFSENEIGDGWFVIYKGKVGVEKRTPFIADQVVAELGPSVCLGEMAILDDSPRSATVVAMDQTQLFHFSKRKFNQLIKSGSLAAYKMVYGMAGTLAKRQRVLNQKYTELQKEIAAMESVQIA